MGISERKEREKERRINEIIDAAEHVFFEKGVNNATMDDVAEKAELSKGTLYIYFKSKEDLHYTIIIRAMELMTEIFQKHISEKLNGLENLLKIGNAYVEFFEKYTNYFNLMMEFHATKIEKVAEEKKKKLLEDDSPLILVSKILEQGQHDGSIRNDMVPIEMAIILWSQLSGFLEFISIRKPMMEILKINESKIIENQFKVLLNGVIKTA